MTEITFNMESLEGLKKAYEENKDQDSFFYDGKEFDTGYAKYLIQYLEMEFGIRDSL